MNKSELIERIIDTFTDMGSEDPVDTAECKCLTLDEAQTYLAERRAMEQADLNEDDWLPEEVTPDLYMEAENCYIRRCRYEVTLDRLTEFIESHQMVELYHEFDGEYTSATDKTVYPTDWLSENMEFPFTPYDLSMLELIRIGQNSTDFNPFDDFCWFDKDTEQLHSTCYPFNEGLLDAQKFAEWILEKPRRTSYVKDYFMINTDIDYVFRYWGY